MNNVVKNSKTSPKKSVTAKQLAKSNLTKRKNPDWDNLDRGYRYLTLDMKLPHDLAVAVMGNVVEESLGDYKSVLKNGRGRGLIQWDGRKAPNGRYSLWGSIWASVAKPANVYDSTTDTVKNYWAPWGGLKGDKVRLKFIKAPLKEKARIYAESYLRPGKPRIADRQLSTMQLDSIYNPRIKDVIVLKNGGYIRKMLTAAGGPLMLPGKSQEEADKINNYNRNKAKGLFKGIVSGKVLPTMSNIGSILGAAYNGWLDPETTAITGEAPNPGMRNPKLIVSSVLTIDKFKNILKNYNPYAYRKPKLPEIKISDEIINDTKNIKIDPNDLFTDNFIKYLEKQTGRKIKRIPYKNTKDGNIYKEGFSFVDENGKEIAHIAGNLKGKNVWVESSYVDPEFRHKGLGKLMYFDFNDYAYNTYGTTLHSSALQRVGYVDGGGMSPSNRLWKSLTDNKLATTEGSGFDWWNIMADPSKIKTAYRKQGGKMNILEFLKNGSGIHIKEKNKGSFTRWCGGNVTEECILKGKNSSNPKIRRKATFADNARHFKHRSGGLIRKALDGTKLANNLGSSLLDIGKNYLLYLGLKNKVSSNAELALAGVDMDYNTALKEANLEVNNETSQILGAMDYLYKTGLSKDNSANSSIFQQTLKNKLLSYKLPFLKQEMEKKKKLINAQTQSLMNLILSDFWMGTANTGLQALMSSVGNNTTTPTTDNHQGMNYTPYSYMS